MFARRVFPVQFSAIASGDGYWCMEKGTRVDFHEIECIITGYRNPDNSVDLYAELCFHHEHDASEEGLCYTDTGVEAGVRAYIKRNGFLNLLFTHVSGSEQGMQGARFMSCDATVENGVTFNQLEDLGFDVEYD